MNIYKRLLLGILLLLLAPLVQARPLVQEFFVTLPEDQVQKALKSLYTGIGAQMQTVISIVVTADNTYINYDHWEDGYEVDLENPIQSSTEVWGPFDKGHVVALRNPVDLPRNPSIVKYDGRDRFGASIAVVASRAEWATSPGPVLAGAAEMLAIRDYGTDFKMPVGQNMSAIGNSMFEFVDMLIVAAQDGTNCTYNGASLPTLNRGSNYQKGGGVLAGDRLTCDKPVEVHLISGDVGATYESRWFLVYPTARWSSDYYSPVGTSANNDIGYIFFYNPDASNAITVHYETLLGTGTLSVPANGTARFQMPVSSGGHFYTTGAQFYAVATLGATPTANNVHDWGFLLVPKGALTTEAVAGWAPGDGNPTPSNDYSPLWVTVEQDTSVYVDYHGDGGSLTAPNGQAYDAVVPIKKLESKIIVASNHDNTGTRLFTTDGTLLSAAWGQNSATAVAGAPALDMGTAVLPFPVPSITKDAALVTTGTSCTAAGGSNDGNGVPAVGECLLYSITINNAGLTTLDAALVSDDLTTGTASAGLSYVTGSTYLNGSPVADGGGFPLAAPGFLIQDIPPGDTSTLTYLAKITQTGSWTNNVILNNPNIHGSHTAIVPPPTPATCTLSFTSTLNGATAPTYSVGDTVYLRLSNADLNQNPAAVETLSVVVKNPATGSKDTEAVLLTETGINTGVFVGSLPSSPSNGQTSNDGTLLFQQGDTIQASSTYPTCAATTASIAVPSETKSLYLTGPGQGLSRTLPTSGTATSSPTLSTATGSSSNVYGTQNFITEYLTLSPAWAEVGDNNNSGTGKVQWVENGAGCSTNCVHIGVGTNVDITNVGLRSPSINLSPATTASVTFRYHFNSATYSHAIKLQASTDGSTWSDTTWSATSGSATAQVVDISNWISASTYLRWVGTGTTGGSTPFALDSVTVSKTTGGGVTSTTFTQTPAMAEAFAMPSGGAVSVLACINVTAGTMPSNPSVSVTLKHGTTTFATLSPASYSATNTTCGGGKALTWSGTLSSDVSVTAGEAISAVFNVTGLATTISFAIQYDATTKPSKIDLPTTTVITVDSLALYDAPYPGGSEVSTANNGQTLYARAQVSDPFGAYDITSVDLGIDGPGLSCDLDAVLGSGNVVHSTTTSKTYESVWATGTCQGNYVVTAVAHEGAEGTVTASGAAQVSLTNLDLGTPGIVQFIDDAGADKTSYTTSQQVCVKVNDLDQAGLSDPIKVYVTGSSSGGPLELTLAGSPANSGIFTGCFGSAGSSSPFVNGDMLTVSYTDPTDGSDVATDAALVTNGTVPSLLLSKTRVAPADGIAVVGEPVQYDISVTNPGATALTTINLTDTYSSTCYSFQSASLTPSTNNPGSLVFSVGPIAAGGTVKLSVTLTAKAACDTTAAQNSVSASGDASAGATTATVTISAPRVTVTKTRTSAADTATVGDIVTFKINVTNSGTTSITTLPVSDTYSTCLQFVSATPTETSAGGGTILWSDLGPLATSGLKTIDTSFKVVGACSSAQNTASVDFAVDANGDRAVESSGSATVTTTAASISGQIIDDNGAGGGTAADGLKNGGEPGIAGVTVKVYRDSDGDGDLNTGTVTLVAVQTSGSNGYYQFLNLVPNAGSERYVVVETDPTNYRSTNPASNQRTVNVAAVQDYSDQDFLDTQFADITGQVVNDNGAGNGTASNGVKDGSEPGISGVTVKLYADVNGDGVADGAALATQTTYSGGNYTFANVAPGRYIVIETDPPGATSTGDKDGTGPNGTGLNTIAVTLGGGINSTGNDFLDYVAAAAVPDVYATVSAPSSVVAGGQVTTLLTFGNQGLANAEGVTYSVTLPLGLTGLSCVGATCDYDPGTGTLTLSGLPGILTPGQVAQLVVSYAAPGTGPLSVSTTIGTTTAGDPSDNNTDTASTVVSSSVVDVAVWLNAPASAVTGSTVSVPVNFTNLGGVTATGVSYSVTLPAGLADVTCTGSGISCSYAGTTVTITGLPESLEPGQIAGLVLSYTAPASGPVAVTATVSATGDSVPTGNNSASGSTAITAATAPDLISLVAPPASAAPGSQVTVPVSYRNLGPDAATVTLYDLDLTGAPVTEVEIRLNGTLCTYDSGTGALTDCGLPGTLGPGQAVDLILTYTAPASGTVTVSSNVTATGETNTANNASTGVTTVSGASGPDVYTTVDVPASVPAGGGITALVTFGNQGPVSAEGVTYAVTLAPGLSGVGCTGAACTYDSVTGVLTLTGLPTSLSSGQSVPILISYLAPASGVSSLSVQSNIATSTAGETPTNNNSASASTLVSGGVTADVTTWISAPPSASSGSTVTVTAGYTNLGAASATGVTYALTFTGSPSGVAVTYNGTACTYTSGTVTGCGLPTTLTPGQVVDLVATFTAPATGPVVSTSTVGAGNDSDTNNNTASASTAISGDTEADVTAAVAPPASAPAGSSVSVPFSFANLGPATAAGMGYGLTLTGGATSPVITHNGATCTYSAGVLSGCGLPTSLAPGETLNLLLTYTAPGSGTVGVTATASTTTTQSNSANDSATGSTAVLTTPTVDVYALVAAPATATGGGTVDVALTFGNQGSGGATGVAYSLLLPAGLSGVSCTDATCVYDSASGVVTLTFSSGSSTLASGATRTATLHYTAPAGAGVVPVVARVSATEDPGTTGNNSATGSTAISAQGVPDVYATVSAPSSVVAGGQVTTLLTFGNQGLANAEGVTYSVTLPLGLTGLSCVWATCDYDPGTGTLTLSGLPGILTPGQVAQLLVSYAAPGTGPLSVSTTIGTTTAGDPSDNNTDTASTVVSSSVVDVAVWLNAPASAVAGSTVSVPVNFTNLGGVTATGVSYSVTLPAGLADVTCTGSGISCSYAGTTVTITGLPESLEPGQIAGLVLSYTAPASGPVAVTATVSATGDSVPTGNNSASGSTAITAATAPDLISLVAPPASAAPGSQVTVPVSYRNLGPDAATVTLYDLDLTGAPVTEVEIRLNGTLCTYDSGTGALTDCGLPGTLGPGQAVDLILTYTAPASGTVTVSSNVTATGETNTANNASTGVTTVSGASGPDVYTTVDVPASVPAGGGITALVTFGNQGPVSAEGVTYAVTLAPGLSGVGCTGAACTYDSVTGVLTLTGLPTSLSSGQSVPILISYLAPASGVSSLSVQSNIATSTAGETPTNNNSASASTLVSGGVTADVTTWISAPPSASSGSTVTVTAGYTNLGAASATGVTYALTFTGSPSGVAVTYNGTACTYTSGTVTGCGLPTTLTPGQVVDLVATFTAPATGPVVSTSTVGAGNDSDTNNNTASASTAISGDTEADVTAAVAPPASAPAGSSVSVPFSFANLGPATAAGMGYGLTLTGGATSPVITHNGATCTYSAGVLSGCGLPTSLAPGETLNLLLTYTAPGSGTVGVTATASTTTTQSNSANDSATGSTAVLTTPTVDVYALVAAPATATGGGTVDVALTFGNQGSGGATGVAYSLLLPAGLSGVSCTDATCVYDSASGVVTLTFSSGSSTLASGATRTATLHYTAPAGAGVVPVVARVSATEDPGTAGNNSATGSTAISQSGPNVFDPPSGHKTVDTQGNPVFLWRMVWINNGNADANLVEVVDTLPSGTSYVAGSLVCDPQGGSSTQFCGYEAAQSRVRWRGTIAGDPGATNEADAQNEVVISFQTRLAAGVSYTENLAQAYWDENGDTNLAGNELVASVPTNGGAPVRGGIAVVPIPVATPVLLVLMGLVLLGLGAIRLRCLT